MTRATFWKVLILVAAAAWHGWIEAPHVFPVMPIEIFPYWLLVLSWRKLRPNWLLGIASVLLMWISWRSGIETLHLREVKRVRSTSGLGFVFAALASCGVVGGAWLVSVFFPKQGRER